MKLFVAAVGAAAALAAGFGFVVLPDEARPHESASPITMADPLPANSVVATVTGIGDLPIPAAPGTVIELTYAGWAAEGHAPCATLEVSTDRVWRATHSLGSAFGPAVSNVPDPEFVSFGAQTSDARVSDEGNRLILTSGEGEGFVVVCPAMTMIGEGPERFRLPLIAPDGPARICLNQSSPCYRLDYSADRSG